MMLHIDFVNCRMLLLLTVYNYCILVQHASQTVDIMLLSSFKSTSNSLNPPLTICMVLPLTLCFAGITPVLLELNLVEYI